MEELLAAVKAFCYSNYENGYDYIVECYSDAELITYFKENNVTNLEEFQESCAGYIEYREEIMATAF